MSIAKQSLPVLVTLMIFTGVVTSQKIEAGSGCPTMPVVPTTNYVYYRDENNEPYELWAFSPIVPSGVAIIPSALRITFPRDIPKDPKLAMKVRVIIDGKTKEKTIASPRLTWTGGSGGLPVGPDVRFKILPGSPITVDIFPDLIAKIAPARTVELRFGKTRRILTRPEIDCIAAYSRQFSS